MVIKYSGMVRVVQPGEKKKTKPRFGMGTQEVVSFCSLRACTSGQVVVTETATTVLVLVGCRLSTECPMRSVDTKQAQ